jgi:preprotein translocase subunit SecA
MHVQIKEQTEQPKLAPQVLNMQTSSADDEDQGQSGFDRAAAVSAAEDAGAPAPAQAAATAKPQTVTKDAFEKTPRNAPCPCGSGKKFKQCHGAA